MSDRAILHCDLNNFYASVECFHNPALRNRPVAVCGDADMRHGIVLAKNYLAKSYGVVTGDVIWQAKQKCPDITVVSADFNKYYRYSRLAHDIYSDYAYRIEPFGIDECWLDVTGDDGARVADEIRARIRTELGVTASVGVSWNKIFAKLGSDIQKPDATTVINRRNYKETVFPLPAGELLFVGRATKRKLLRCGIETIGDIARSDVALLRSRLGKWGEYLWIYANGLDDSPVREDGVREMPKSVGNSATAPRDLVDSADVRLLATILAESVSQRLWEQGLRGNVVSLWVRDCNLQNWSRRRKTFRPVWVSSDLIDCAMSLFSEVPFNQPVRSIGISVSDLSPRGTAVQPDFFTSAEELRKKETLENTMLEIRRKFGHNAINRAVEYRDRKIAESAERVHGYLPAGGGFTLPDLGV